MNNLQKIGKFEAIGLISMIIINQIVLNLPNTLILTSGSSAWLNTIYITIFAVAFGLLICKLFKPFEASDIVDVSEFLGGKWLKLIIGILYILFFVFFSGVLLRYLASSLRDIYFRDTPIIFVLLFFVIPSAIVAKFGVKVIAKINLIFTPILLVSLLFAFIATAKYFVPQRFFPILGFGINKTFIEGIVNIFSFTGLAYLYFLIPILKNPQEFKNITIISLICSGLFLLLSIICLLMLFPFISFTDEMLSLYLVVRLIEFGRFFQRIDAVFILIWISAFLSFLSISISISSNIYKKLTNIKSSSCMCFLFSSLVFSIALSIENIAIIKYIQNVVFKYIILILVFGISFIILLFGYLKKKRKIRI